MRLFIYEFICGGGMWALGDQAPAGSLLEEGRAMLQALVQDLSAIEGTSVVVARDSRLSDGDLKLPGGVEVEPLASAQLERATLARLAKSADATLLIAPEFYGILAERCGWITSTGSLLWSPPIGFVQLASNKSDTAWRLRLENVPVPEGVLWAPSLPWPPSGRPTEPVVLKPNDGCGSQQVRLVERPEDWPSDPPREPTRVEQFIPGLAASIAVLNGPENLRVPLPACRQHLSHETGFRYQGGSLPLADPLQERAERLALMTLQAFPPTCGYVGIDFILGAADDGSEDKVIEINPRLTTSYVGLRKSCRGNLAEAMLQVCQGIRPVLEFAREPLTFSATGTDPVFDEGKTV